MMGKVVKKRRQPEAKWVDSVTMTIRALLKIQFGNRSFE